MTFLRFVVAAIDADSGRRMGLFFAVDELLRRGLLSKHEAEAATNAYDWFSRQLKRPNSFARSAKPKARNVAICWFKDSAVAHVRRMWEFVNVLQENEVHVQLIRTRQPGYVVYEDEHQVVAEPFHSTKA